MKRLICVLCISFILLSCKTETANNKYDTIVEDATQKDDNAILIGTWELVGFYNYTNNIITDSFNTNESYRQVKIFTPSKVMWSKSVPKDTTEWFGFGSYDLNDTALTEVLDYGSKIMSEIIQEKKEFTYEINVTENSYIQIELDEDGNRIYSENYKRIE